MNNIIDLKDKINCNVNELLSVINNISLNDNSQIESLAKENKLLNSANTKLIQEISDKDKIISMNQKTICDYEKQINSFNEQQEETNKFDMVKAKDKEVHEQNKLINSLRKEIDTLKSKLELTSSNNIKCEVHDTDINSEENVSENNSDKDGSDKDVSDKENVEQSDDNVSNKSSDDSEDDVDAVTVVYRKKEYYVINEDGKQKVFEILDDGNAGKELGIWENDKIVRPDKKKKK